MSRTRKDQITTNRHSLLRSLLARGDVEEAGKRAADWGIDILDVRLPANFDGPPEVLRGPVSAPEETPPSPIPSSPSTPSAPIQSRWPVETDLVVEGQPINPRMLVVRLPDQRRATMWKRGTTYPVRAMVKGRLVDQVGSDAYYEPIVDW